MNSKSMGGRQGSEATERQGAHSDPLRSWRGDVEKWGPNLL